MDPNKFIIRCKNIKKLYDQNVYTFTEYTEEIEKLIAELSNSKIETNEEDFLLILVPLINDNILNSENLDKIKLILKRIYTVPVNHSKKLENKYVKVAIEIEKHPDEKKIEVKKTEDEIVFKNKSEQEFTHVNKNKSSKIYILSVLFLIFITFVYLIFNTDKVSLNKITSNSSDSKILTEENPKISLEHIEEENSTNVENRVLAILNSWIFDINNRNNIKKYYSENVNYYSWGIVSKSRLMTDKNSFYSMWDSFLITIENPEVRKISENIYNITYEKKASCSNNKTGKKYETKVKSILGLKRDGSNWLISEEIDELIYYKK